MGNLTLQSQIETLQETVQTLLGHITSGSFIYSDTFSELHHQIHHQINELYPRRGETTDQEAALCLAMLMGYSVSMYANPEDETKRQVILNRSQKLLEILPSSLLKQQLSAIYNEMQNLCEIN